MKMLDCRIMCRKILILIIVTVVTVSLVTSNHGHNHDNHGGVPMGIPNKKCDTGKDNLEMDWDTSNDLEYRCQFGLFYEKYQILRERNERVNPVEECLDEDDIPDPLHICMDKPIVYKDPPPVAGPHRPIWPAYGQYVYIPPQRWVHSLEHGAAVFLYHPCADPQQIEALTNLAKSCLRKHIITPYGKLSPERPYAVIAYGCRLLMNRFDKERATNFVKRYAMEAPESSVKRDGHYNLGLRASAQIVSDAKDSKLCPKQDLLTAENMFDRP